MISGVSLLNVKKNYDYHPEVDFFSKNITSPYVLFPLQHDNLLMIRIFHLSVNDIIIIITTFNLSMNKFVSVTSICYSKCIVNLISVFFFSLLMLIR